VASKDKTIEALNAHLKQWREIEERIKSQVSPILKQQQEALQISLQPIIDAQKAFQEVLEPILAEQKRWKKLVESIQIPKYELHYLSYLSKQASEFQKSIKGFISPVFEQLQKSFRELPPRTRDALLLLGAHGWYWDLEMSLLGLWKLKKALSEGNVEEAEGALIEYFESRIDEIERSIAKRFPKRETLIRAAFNAHRRKEYELSIPVLLAQTDGICKEVVNEYLFIKQNKKPRTAIYVEQVASDSFRAALLSPLAQTLPVSASKHERKEGFNELNRHMVLHGESLEYGSKINSLKAISLLNYVAHVLTLKNKIP
jgi:hypothetical protein